jgi:hypothetical protein
MESDSQESCSRQYGTRLFPGMGATGPLRKLWQIALELYDDLVGLDWRWKSVDGAMTKAPLGGESIGKTQRIVRNREQSDRYSQRPQETQLV